MPIIHVQHNATGKRPDGTPIAVPPPIVLMQKGPRVPVRISIQKNFTEQLALSGGSQKDLTNSMEGTALIDTGAFMSCIDEEVAKNLGLSAIDVVNMTSASHESTEVNIYPARIEIVAGQTLKFDMARVLGVNLKKQQLIALIGRDILSRCTLFYNGVTGQITLSI